MLSEIIVNSQKIHYLRLVFRIYLYKSENLYFTFLAWIFGIKTSLTAVSIGSSKTEIETFCVNFSRFGSNYLAQE